MNPPPPPLARAPALRLLTPSVLLFPSVNAVFFHGYRWQKYVVDVRVAIVDPAT